MTARTVPTASIAIGERDRADMGDITALADSIKAVGLLHPIVVTEALTLVAGGRRLEATRRLGWTEVPVTVVESEFQVIAAMHRQAGWDHTHPLSPYEALLVYEETVPALRRWHAIHAKVRATAIYRFFNAAGELLYVGITCDTERRFRNHAADKAWWPEVANRTVAWLDTRYDAETAEARAIRDESPIHNIAVPVAILRELCRELEDVA